MTCAPWPGWNMPRPAAPAGIIRDESGIGNLRNAPHLARHRARVGQDGTNMVSSHPRSQRVAPAFDIYAIALRHGRNEALGEIHHLLRVRSEIEFNNDYQLGEVIRKCFLLEGLHERLG